MAALQTFAVSLRLLASPSAAARGYTVATAECLHSSGGSSFMRMISCCTCSSSSPSTCATQPAMSYSRHLSTSTATAAEPAAEEPPAAKGPTHVLGMSQKSLRRQARHRYEQQRAAWKRQLTALRKQWLAEHKQQQQQAEARHQQLLLQRKVQQEAERAQQGVDAAAKQQQRLLREAQQAELAVEVAKRRYQAAMRAELRRRILSEHQQQRRSHLEVASAGWIPQAQFEARLDAALDHPTPL